MLGLSSSAMSAFVVQLSMRGYNKIDGNSHLLITSFDLHADSRNRYAPVTLSSGYLVHIILTPCVATDKTDAWRTQLHLDFGRGRRAAAYYRARIRWNTHCRLRNVPGSL